MTPITGEAGPADPGHGSTAGPQDTTLRRFVLLEHSWNGVHWDLMLEEGPVLHTWAIDSRLSPDTDLPARRLPAHRRAYLDYEGAVSGGRGSVRRIDRGTYEVVIWSSDRIRVRLAGAQLVGDAELRKAGAAESSISWIFRFGNLD